LELLSPNTDLVAVTIEGSSSSETPDAAPIEAGEDVIDIAEYFRSEELEHARLVRYMQLKHSTLHSDDPWTASELKKTIEGFAARYVELKKIFDLAALREKIQFWFVTNRPIRENIIGAVSDAALAKSPRFPGELKKLESQTGLSGEELATFCTLMHFEDRQTGYWEQRNILFQEASGYLPDADADAPLQLKELVTRRALSEGEQDPSITKMDVLRALKTDEARLFPAECLISDIKKAVSRDQDLQIVKQIVDASVPVVVYAAGGVGKSVLATRIGAELPEGSACILYDCFGNGQYRSATGYRHRHKDALVQIANEMAAKGLCHPLIPTANADAVAYVRAFVYRLKQAAEVLRGSTADALLCIVIDAADNAQMAAEEVGEARSFARDLIRASLPVGVRLVFLCRPHRQKLLDPPVETTSIELLPFNRDETATLLCERYPQANEHDIDEFHRLSSQNPRVQALALSRDLPLPEMLRLLGPNPTSVDDTIGSLLEHAIEKLKDSSGPVEAARVEKMCAGLAALRPLIPIQILSAISGVEQDAIKSFAYDIGRPLMVAGETIQFLDEPTETWFRGKFKPTADKMTSFIASLKPLAGGSAYAASMLPQLMLEAGQFSELVALALSSSALPDGSPLEKRDVNLQRLQFALKAGLRSSRYLDATKLALKAGGETAGDERQTALLQENTDLASVFLELDLIQEIVSRRTFGSGWVGSHHAYEAALLSARPELVGDARSRLRMAHEWLRNWANLSADERKEEEISDRDIGELTLARLNIYGPRDAVHSLSTWRPKDVSYRIGRLVVRRLIDHGRLADVEDLARASATNLCLALAVAVELRDIQRTPPREVTERAFGQLMRVRIRPGRGYGWNGREVAIEAVTALVEAALKDGICEADDAASVLSRHLPSSPPRGLSSRYSYARFPILRAYCLRAALRGQRIGLIDLAHAELREEIEKNNVHSMSRDLREFKEDVGPLLPWHTLWSEVLLHRVDKSSIEVEIAKASKLSAEGQRYGFSGERQVENGVALQWIDILIASGALNDITLASFNSWKDRLKQPLFTQTLNALCRLFSQNTTTKHTALAYASESYTLTKDERTTAESKASDYIEVARAIFTTSNADARAYFNEAMEVAGKIGDENLSRWDAILDLAERAKRVDRPSTKVAFDFARCAELTYAYVLRDKHFDWTATVKALSGLCPASAITILSRWRDRGFGWHERLLPVAIGDLIERGILDPRDALPLIGIRAQWDYVDLLKAALTRASSKGERESIGQVFFQYVRFMLTSSSELKRLDLLAKESGLTLDGLTAMIASSASQEQKQQQREAAYRSPPRVSEDDGQTKWDIVFHNKNVATVDGLSSAYRAFRGTDAPWYDEEFIRAGICRVPVGSEACFVTAFAEMPELNLYSFRSFLKILPEEWRTRPAISQAFAAAAKRICQRFCMDVAKFRHFEVFPFELVCSISGVSQGDLVDLILTAIGETPELVDTNRLFSLTGLLATKLSHDEALDALAYGLALFSSMLEDRDGDGPWSEAFSPPSQLPEAVAGYVWSLLAAPEAVLRWEAAHVVVELCRLHRQDIITHLMRLAASGQGGPFVDANLPFYKLHATQWLLIGLARASLEAPGAVAPYAQKLVDLALPNQQHVMIRQFASRAARQLIETGHLINADGLLDRLESINRSSLPIIDSKHYARAEHRDSIDEPEADDDRFYFGIDMGPYWYAPLGRAFALSESHIEREAIKVIRSEFGIGAKSSLDNDERSRRNLYEDRHRYHDRGSYPRSDDLRFYYSYHAMMIVAGRLLATDPTHHDSECSDEDEFTEWLSSHDLTRQDGRWLWDRRDPTPLSRGKWLDRADDHADRRRVTNEDFENALKIGDDLTVWGHWTEADETREQTTSVYSALVAPDRSEALLRALATTKNIHDYGIPSAGSDMEIDKYGFSLKGWILDRSGSKRLDEYDRWAGNASFPLPQPLQSIAETLNLRADLDLRLWKDQSASHTMQSQVWGHYDEAKDHEISNPNEGNRLIASEPLIASLLTELDKDLIVEVQIERRRRHRSYENSEKNDDERIKATAKLFLIGKDGRVRTF
jgi:hypothetical protein